jgi:hypothetical protein
MDRAAMHNLSSCIADLPPFLGVGFMMTWTGPCITYNAPEQREGQFTIE